MIYFLSTVFILYFFLLIFLIIGWYLAIPKRAATERQNHFISIVVAARDEQENIKVLLNSVTKINYPSDALELIVVDDNSSDETVAIVNGFFQSEPGLRSTLLKSNGDGKKHALTMGIGNARGDIILTTDADCIIPPNLLVRINQFFSIENIHLLVGPVVISSGDFFSRLQAIEFASVVGTGAATIGLGRPTMCNGANLAFRKSSFIKVNGYEGNHWTASGDDQFLMEKINRSFPKSIAFLNFSDAVVATYASGSIVALIDQRIRWAGKWKEMDLMAQVLAVFIFLFQMTWIISFSSVLIAPSGLLISLVGAKIFSEFFFLSPVSKFLGIEFKFFPFILLQFLYAPYVIWVAVASQIKSFVWKGRTYRYS